MIHPTSAPAAVQHPRHAMFGAGARRHAALRRPSPAAGTAVPVAPPETGDRPRPPRGFSPQRRCQARPLVFLDIDGVLCPNEPFTGFDALHALGIYTPYHSINQPDPVRLWQDLFSEEARVHLNQLAHDLDPEFVISSNWNRWFTKERLSRVFHCTGMGGIVRRLHPDWKTENDNGEPRRDAVEWWLMYHPERSSRWLAIDDSASGRSFIGSPHLAAGNVVLCDPAFCYTQHDHQRALAALR